MPFNQNIMERGYSRLAKSIPGKLTFDGWGTRGAFQLEEASVLSSAVNFLTGGVETNELDTENDETTTTEEVVVEENETTDND